MNHEEALNLVSWREGAACGKTTGIDFFSDDDHAQAIAKAVCAGCPVVDDCLSFAIETNQPDGIWGGLDRSERSRLRRDWLRELRRAS